MCETQNMNKTMDKCQGVLVSENVYQQVIISFSGYICHKLLFDLHCKEMHIKWLY